MGQKVNPIGMRVAVNKDWSSRWYAGKREFGALLREDLMIRALIHERLSDAAVPRVIIERYANRARVTIFTARPGIVIGRRGGDIEKIREELATKTGREIYVEIREVRDPDTNAQLVAENIAVQLKRRISFRRAMKRAVQLAMDNGALGIKVEASGRLGGSELARRESYKSGKIPLHTLRANVQYGFTEANTVAGAIGVKVWVCKEQEAGEPAKEKSYAAHA